MADDNSKNNKRKKKKLIGMIRFEIVKKNLKRQTKVIVFNTTVL